MNMFAGILLIVLAGTCEGLFSLGVTRTPKWSFENIWFAGSLIALLLIPWPLAVWAVPNLGNVYGDAGALVVTLTILCGIGWGLGGIFWGKAVAALGVALGVSLLMALINVFGSLGPMAVFEPAKIATVGGMTLAGSVAVMIAGVVLMSYAGRLKAGKSDRAGQARYGIGILFCVLSGVLSALVNFGFILGAPIAKRAAMNGTSTWAVSFATWALVFSASFAVNAVYGLMLMLKNKTFSQFTKGGIGHWLWALFMGITWPGGIVIYGMGAGMMGDCGAYAAFPMMILMSILACNAAGALTGEWKQTAWAPRLWMGAGVLVLFVAFILLGFANRFMAQ